ncbi:hypothetical protein KGQ19_15520 [Catenulispora sp. NL8]|uniref:Terminal beta-(1->2)-arabinofuranosyltransferase C-terminal domain-containing protein n=1 Tax=Catenulispora pinistramenti TaxID=2705254 RepID=A0ABS5KQF5_9ACTN|nr:hypothetical protein [Catenulispora pinistramenti]MBS2548273.1 hypothetical protein [Catenulispora pinistramenti]
MTSAVLETPESSSTLGALRSRLGNTGTRGAIAIASVVVPTLVFAALVYQRRWMSDDGLIAVRQAHETLAGHGPNFTPFERDEVNTSVLWGWCLVVLGLLPIGLEHAATLAGGVFAVLGVGLAAAGAARFHQGRATGPILVPAGVLVIVGVDAFWDFGTSGLETGLGFFWLGASWTALVGLGPDVRRRRLFATTALFGLGELVRPDFAIVTAVFLVATWLLARPRRKDALLAVAATAAVPAVYEVFRAGYYGILVPMPGLAKEAANSDWGRGATYLNDYLSTYALWLPMLLLTLAVGYMFGKQGYDRRTVVLVAAPLAAAAIMVVYVVHVGGDYMHARMMLPATFVALCPVMLLPLTRVGGVLAAAVAVWAAGSAVKGRTPYENTNAGAYGVVNERSYEVAAFHDPHPLSGAKRVKGTDWQKAVSKALASGRRELVFSTPKGLMTVALAADKPGRIAMFAENMGMVATVLPLDDGDVIDVYGLTSPLSGHLEMADRVRAGHEKMLPLAWVLADYGDPAAVDALPYDPDATPQMIAAARQALKCGGIKDLLDSVRQPMTAGRFFDNLTGSLSRNSMRLPDDPAAAVKQFCPAAH